MTDLENPPDRTPLDVVEWANEDGIIGFAHPGKGQSDWYSYASDLRAIREAQRLGYIVFKRDESVKDQQRDVYEVTALGREAAAAIPCYQCGKPSNGIMTASGDYNALREHLCEDCKPPLAGVNAEAVK